MSKSICGDDLPWVECTPFLVEGEYFRLNQIENIGEQEMLRVCGAVIKLPTARIMLKYARRDCNQIRVNKALLDR